MSRFHGCWICIGIILAALATMGCDDSAGTGGADMDSLAAQIEQGKQAATAVKAVEEAKIAKEKAAAEKTAELAAKQAEAEAAKLAAPTAPAPENETSITITVKNPQGLLNGMQPTDGSKTTAGAGALGQGGGYYSAIAGAHHYMKHAIEDLTWKTAVKSYWAEEGHYPQSHEEFMKCLKRYDTELPALEQGEEYLYDPKEGEFGTLYVVTQAPEAQPGPEPQTPVAPLQ